MHSTEYIGRKDSVCIEYTRYYRITPPPPDFPSPSLIGEVELGRVGGSCRRPMGAACLPASGNPVPSNVVPCSPTVPCSHQPANRFQFSSTDSLPAAGSSAWAGGLCVLCRSSPPRPTLAATLPFFPHPLPAVPVASGHPLNPTGPALPLPRPPAATVWIVSSQQIDICFPACTITSPWSTPPLRRDYQRGVSIAEVGAAATQYLDNVRQRDSRAPRPTSERTPPFTLITHSLHTKLTQHTPRD